MKNLKALLIVLLFPIATYCQDVPDIIVGDRDEVEDPETGEMYYMERDAGGNPKNCFDKNGKPKKCDPEVVNVPLDNVWGLAALCVGAFIAFLYINTEPKKDDGDYTVL